jgi:ABC-2 type transport system permease protein
MKELYQFCWLKYHRAIASARRFWRGSRLRRLVVGGAGLVFWLLMLVMFLRVFSFLERFGSVSDILTDYLFAFLFLALLIMMAISNAIICYSSFYWSDEAEFLMSLPARVEQIFLYKSFESILFSAWGIGMLVVPLILAYGATHGAPWHYYPLSLALALAFMGFPMEIGALIALLVPLIVPRRRRVVLALTVAVGLGILILWITSLLGQRPSRLLSEAGLKQVMDRIAFCQHWALPSHWVSEGMLAAARSEPRKATFLLLMVLSNVLFLGMVSVRLGKSLFLPAWGRAHAGGRHTRRFPPDGLVDRCARACLFLLPRRLRLLVIKDFRAFRRDPAQWSQVLLFFGLLGLYILNLPRFGFAALAPYWHSLVSLLNLGATCLTLSTLTSRFIFPQLSLEGRRIWVVGLLPMKRSTVLWGKFFFAAGGSFLVSGGLIALSDFMLGLQSWVIGVHMIVMLCACVGLNGLAVGLGTVYPNMRSDNPSEIVSGFGGTLNLICSIFFILLTILLIAIPLHLHAINRLVGQDFRAVLAGCLGLEITLAVIAGLVPMWMGMRSFKRMEF